MKQAALIIASLLITAIIVPVIFVVFTAVFALLLPVAFAKAIYNDLSKFAQSRR